MGSNRYGHWPDRMVDLSALSPLQVLIMPANQPMKRTKALRFFCEDCRAGAARLVVEFEGRSAAPAVLSSTVTYRPSPLIGKPLVRQAKLGASCRVKVLAGKASPATRTECCRWKGSRKTEQTV